MTLCQLRVPKGHGAGSLLPTAIAGPLGLYLGPQARLWPHVPPPAPGADRSRDTSSGNLKARENPPAGTAASTAGLQRKVHSDNSLNRSRFPRFSKNKQKASSSSSSGCLSSQHRTQVGRASFPDACCPPPGSWAPKNRLLPADPMHGPALASPTGNLVQKKAFSTAVCFGR